MGKDQIIKSRQRVQKHGEVFTPKKTIKKMLDQPGIKEACNNLLATFLEPAAGEGAFLTAILERKLKLVAVEYNKSFEMIENYSLLVLTTLYGIELLEDNTQICILNLYQTFNDFYLKQAKKFGHRVNKKVQDSAKLIISTNIEQGNFLEKVKSNGKPIIFSQWDPQNIENTPTKINISRTQFSLEDIQNRTEENNQNFLKKPNSDIEQLDLFSISDNESSVPKGNSDILEKFGDVNITEVYREETIEYYETD